MSVNVLLQLTKMLEMSSVMMRVICMETCLCLRFLKRQLSKIYQVSLVLNPRPFTQKFYTLTTKLLRLRKIDEQPNNSIKIITTLMQILM